MKRRLLGNPLWLSLVMAGILFWIQIDAAYFIDRAEEYRQWGIYASVAAVLVFFLLLAVYTGIGRRGDLTHWGGESSVFLGATGVAAGATLFLQTGYDVWAYWKTATYPAPYYTVFGTADRWFFYGTLIFGVLGGIGLLVLGALWLFGGRAERVAAQWMGIFPILWAFCRLARYVQSYVSTIRNAYSAMQAAVLILSLLFFYMLGQHLNGRLNSGSIKLPACAFTFGVAAVSAFFARWFLQKYCGDLTAGVVFVVDGTDLACGAFALAVGTLACSKKAAQKKKEYDDWRELATQMQAEDTTPTVTRETEEDLALRRIEEAVAVPVEKPSEAPAEEAIEEAVEEAVAEPTEEAVEETAEELPPEDDETNA